MLMALTLSVGIAGQSVMAVEEANNEPLIKLDSKMIEQCVKDTALNWAEVVKPDIELTAGDVDSINIVDSDTPEYTVSFFNGNTPYGYAVVIFQDYDAIIKEANLNPGEEGLYENLVDTAADTENTSEKNLAVKDQIIEIAPTQYAVAARKKTESASKEKIYDNFGNVISSKKLATHQNYKDVRNIFIDKSNWTEKKYKVDKKSKIELKKFKDRSTLFSESKIEGITKKYCCVTQASTQIAYMQYLTSKSTKDLKDTYNKLWKYQNVKKTKTINHIDYGSATADNANKGLVKLAKDCGYSKTKEQKIQKNPSTDWIKEKLKNNKPILLLYGINVNGQRKGHAISVLGYMKAKKVASGRTWNYLEVYNSWDDTVKYLNYTTVDFMDCKAIHFDFKN